MKAINWKRAVTLTLPVFLVALFVIPAFAQTEENPLADVLAQIKFAQRYELDATSQQTLIPRASSANIGRTSESFNVYFSGDVTGPQQTELALRVEGMGMNAPAMQFEQDGNSFFTWQDGERVLMEDAPASVTTVQSPAAFIASAENILPTTAANATTAYTFDINGSKLATYWAQEINANAPANERVAPPAQFQAMSGSAEIWLDENGWLQRLILNLDVPAIDAENDLRSRTVIDYAFNEEDVAAWDARASFDLSVPDNAISSWVAETATPELAIHLSIFAIALLFSISLVRNEAGMRKGAPAVISFVMVGMPILQLFLFAPRSAEAASFQDVFTNHMQTAQPEVTQLDTASVALAPVIRLTMPPN